MYWNRSLCFMFPRLFARDKREFSHIIYWKIKREETVLLWRHRWGVNLEGVENLNNCLWTSSFIWKACIAFSKRSSEPFTRFIDSKDFKKFAPGKLKISTISFHRSQYWMWNGKNFANFLSPQTLTEKFHAYIFLNLKENSRKSM